MIKKKPIYILLFAFLSHPRVSQSILSLTNFMCLLNITLNFIYILLEKQILSYIVAYFIKNSRLHHKSLQKLPQKIIILLLPLKKKQ